MNNIIFSIIIINFTKIKISYINNIYIRKNICNYSHRSYNRQYRASSKSKKKLPLRMMPKRFKKMVISERRKSKQKMPLKGGMSPRAKELLERFYGATFPESALVINSTEIRDSGIDPIYVKLAAYFRNPILTSPRRGICICVCICICICRRKR
eukprot:GHVL01016332.1.p1 GENE.GHVL01016332.1~~GHVL01016332.1.p1  ORF type:complete len:154 (-),score=36.83 GHVL01016332.1:732-1193(-)